MRALEVCTIAFIGFLTLCPARASAGEIVVLTSGERMDVESFEIQSNFVVVKTWDGRLRSLPMAFVDLPATEEANAGAELEERIAPERLERARLACETFGVSSAVSGYARALTSQVAKARGFMSMETFDQLRAAFRNAFDEERSVDFVVAHLARSANLDLLDEFNAWLSDPFVERMLRLEDVAIEGAEEQAAQRYYIKLATKPAELERREALVSRLDEARQTSESGAEIVIYLMKAFFEAGRQVFPDEPIEFDEEDEEELRRALIPRLREGLRLGLIVQFRDVSDAELERYVAAWETTEGERVAKFLNTALESGAMEGSDVALEILTGKRQTVP